MIRPTLVLAALLLASPAAAARKHPGAGVAGDPDACLSCHAKATPQVVKDWEGGPHGLMLVKCFVCHGSTGKDFAAHPAAGRRCEGCHPAQVSSLAPTHAVQACFACHAPHTLAAQGQRNPHTPQ
jgi:hypothetical protein